MGKRPTSASSAEADSIPPSEAAAFRDAVRDVKPLPQPPAVAGRVIPAPRAARRRRAPEVNLDESMPLLPAQPVADQLVSGTAELSFQRAGVRTQVMRRLRRGLIPVEDELDLHGLAQSAARSLLSEFLTRSRDQRKRCVRIIHGKGCRSGARGPVLKTAVDSWLRRHADVIAFTSAKAIDGGTGAVYVLLRA